MSGAGSPDAFILVLKTLNLKPSVLVMCNFSCSWTSDLRYDADFGHVGGTLLLLRIVFADGHAESNAPDLF